MGRAIGWRSGWALVLALAAAACGGGAAGGEAEGETRAERAPDADPGSAPRESADAGASQEDSAPVEVNDFLSYEPADSLADLKLWAGWLGRNGAWNFDGYFAGNATVAMPLGWEVLATFQNLDANVPHSVAVIEAEGPVPASAADATIAFKGASSGNLTAGYSSREQPRTFRFTADREGRFRIYCGVPSHGPGGMWIWFEVSAGLDAPEFRTE